ncbi:hypothetical protein DFH09DRAFT_1102906 [Mycena vulgaris]|nr:hypothetical protein DFH09DRAFT_1102906 [Mycena vulgaris]
MLYTLNEVHLPFYLFPNYPDHNNPELANIFKSWESLRKTLSIVGREGIGLTLACRAGGLGVACTNGLATCKEFLGRIPVEAPDIGLRDVVEHLWLRGLLSGSIASSDPTSKNPAKPDTRKLGNALLAGQLNVKNLIETKWAGGVFSAVQFQSPARTRVFWSNKCWPSSTITPFLTKNSDPQPFGIPAVVNDTPKCKEERKGRGSPRRSARETTELTTKNRQSAPELTREKLRKMRTGERPSPTSRQTTQPLVRETGSVDNRAVGSQKNKEMEWGALAMISVQLIQKDTGSGDVVILNQKCVKTCSPEVVKGSHAR